MSADPSFLPAGLGSAPAGVAIAFVDADLKAGPATTAFLEPVREQLARAAEADGFKGKALSALDLLAPAGLPVQRLVVVGLGKAEEIGRTDWVKAGGYVMGRLPGSATEAGVLLEGPDGPLQPEQAADLALGMRLRAYAFDRYKTKRKEGEADKDAPGASIRLMGADEAALGEALGRAQAIGEGVALARNLINEPPNVLFPQAFAARLGELKALGVEVEVLDEGAMAEIGMRALLGVGQGSEHASRVVILRWNGGAPDAQPVAFIGKGVTFDTGGISLKPGAGMEDMKGDMGGAACVAGLMHALAARGAKANVIGAVGLVENMPDGKAQRPGDIVTSLSGQTIEIINTDAEGRLVLADVLWHVKERYKPRFMVDLATLTGAILVALAQEYAGLFSNDDELSARLFEAGTRTGERVWRLPLGPEYDKMIDSKFADMKNTGGRHGGSITAAQFLQRFVGDTPWAHLDIAGTAMGSPTTEINRSWASGWGVRLLDRLVADHYEA